MSVIHFEASDGIGLITLDNPPLNLVTVELTRVLSEKLDELVADSNVRVLILSGSGDRAFCAGSDIHEFSEFVGPDGNVLERKLIAENAMYSKLDKFPKPTVAAMNGHAMGGGLEMAACCDLLVAGDNIKLGLPEVNLGVIPGSGGTVRVTRRIGEGRAKEMMLLGEPIDAQTAFSWGLVNRVVPEGTALEMSRDLAKRLAELPNRALQLCKQAIDLSFDTDEADAIERTLALSDEVFRTDDVSEGIRAFSAKEKPNFQHR